MTVAVVGVLAGTTYLIGRPVVVDAFAFVLFIAVVAAPLVAKRVRDQAYVAVGAALGIALRH